MVFSEIEDNRPVHTAVLPNAAFSGRMRKRPKGDMCVGIAMPSFADWEAGKAYASRLAVENHPKDVRAQEQFQRDALVMWIVARGTCDPNDTTKPFECWAEAPEDQVKDALTIEGAKFLFDAISKAAKQDSPAAPEADDEEISLFSTLADEMMKKLPEWKQGYIRRSIAECWDILTAEAE